MMNTKTTDKKIQLSNIKLSINDENNEANGPVPAPDITKPGNNENNDDNNNNKKNQKKNLENENITTRTRAYSKTINVNVSFCSHVGWDGMLIILFCICMSGVLYGLHIYILKNIMH